MKSFCLVTLVVVALAAEVCYVAAKPNILFILTDDQDVFLNGTVGVV